MQKWRDDFNDRQKVIFADPELFTPDLDLTFLGVKTSVGDPWHFGVDPDPDPTPFFSDFKDAKKKNFKFFSYNLPLGTLSSV